MKKTDLNLDDARKLLALKRLELPSEDYFRQVLPEFHRRQAEVANLSLWARWQAAVASFTEAFSYRSALQYSMPVLAAVGLIGLTLNGLEGERTVVSSPMLALEVEAPISNQGFAFDEEIAASTAMPELQIELDTLPHYVLADSASSYDANLAF